MSFYTSNSNHQKKFYLSLLLAVLFFSIPCAAIYFYTLTITNKNAFLTNAESKAKHMVLNSTGNAKPDIIFIGSSRTLFHIDTGYFSKLSHFKSYNYGLDGHIISSYPYMVKEAITVKPKIIVITLDLQDLYSPPEPTRDVYLTDLFAYLKTHQDFNFMVTSLEYYIAGFNSIRQYSTSIHQFIVEKTKAFASRDTYNMIPNKLLQQYGYCKPFLDEKNVGANIKLIRCQNGDGILFGNAKPLPKKVIQLTQLNYHTFLLLKYSLDEIKKNHITPIIILSPSYATTYNYHDLATLQENLAVKIIDLTNLSLPIEYWANDNHLNYAGREVFTKTIFTAGHSTAWS